jgi:hypothetical protein
VGHYNRNIVPHGDHTSYCYHVVLNSNVLSWIPTASLRLRPRNNPILSYPSMSSSTCLSEDPLPMSITHHATCTPDPCPPRLPLHLFMLHCYHQHLSYVARIDSSQESDRLPSLPLANSQIKLEAWGLLTRSYTLGTLEDGIDMLDSTLPSQLINLSGTLHLDSSPTRGVTRHGV